MKYEQCLTCKQLGDTCDGANFLAMETAELAQWCNERRKKIPGLTYDKIAAETGVSKSAVYGFLTGAHTDYRLETIRPILKICVGGNWDNNPCGNIDTSERAAYEAKIQQLENELKHEKEKNTKDEKEVKFLVKQLELTQKQSSGRRIAIIVLGVALGITLALIIAALIVDRLNPDAGYFWLRSFFQSNNPIKYIGS